MADKIIALRFSVALQNLLNFIKEVANCKTIPDGHICHTCHRIQSHLCPLLPAVKSKGIT